DSHFRNGTAIFSMALLTVCTYLSPSPMIWLCHLDTVEVDMRNFGFVVLGLVGFSAFSVAFCTLCLTTAGVLH
ncbi:hypothetical protein, partial [Pantoea ananatis]|uniref:hypothetical protein n=1 Tax=Pantoea ananas TaxID=553 RepID=UPI001C4012C2